MGKNRNPRPQARKKFTRLGESRVRQGMAAGTVVSAFATTQVLKPENDG
jgi:hypothetical protein